MALKIKLPSIALICAFLALPVIRSADQIEIPTARLSNRAPADDESDKRLYRWARNLTRDGNGKYGWADNLHQIEALRFLTALSGRNTHTWIFAENGEFLSGIQNQYEVEALKTVYDKSRLSYARDEFELKDLLGFDSELQIRGLRLMSDGFNVTADSIHLLKQVSDKADLVVIKNYINDLRKSRGSYKVERPVLQPRCSKLFSLF